MASLIPGYQYDIFISYRQKDNKGDRWVSEFVEALRDELESTFKEEISLYFDINPHDGLLETHEVADSLKEKLKCLIFIPVLSRTYCDPKSFAWENEFVAFVNQASHDQFGLKVRLPGGNVASRVLPIRIHDLDSNDIAICESVTGGVLRGVEFIYKSPGVNRPLRPKEEKAQENLNNTIYRDQINKVALAIKDIILGLKSGSVFPVIEKDQTKELTEEVIKVEVKRPSEHPSRTIRNKILSGAALLTLLIIAAMIFYPKIFNRGSLERPESSDKRISVVILPFQNMTNDKGLNYLQETIQDQLINDLTNNSDELRMEPRERINSLLKGQGITSYLSISPAVAVKISEKLGADLFISGSINQSGSTLRVNVQITDSKTGDVLKPFSNEGSFKDKDIIPILDPLSRKVKNYLIISGLKDEVYIDPQRTGSSESPDAYRYFTYGQKAFASGDYTDAINMLSRAVHYDSNLIYATLHVGWAYYNLQKFDSAKAWCLKAYRKIDRMSPAQEAYTNFVHARFFGMPNEAIKYLKRLQDIDDQWPHLHFDMGYTYNIILQYDRAIPEFVKSLEMYRSKGIKPWWSYNYTNLGRAYHATGQYKIEKQLYSKAIMDFPENPAIIQRQAILAYSEGDTSEAENYIEKYISVRKDNSVSEASVMNSLAFIYSEAGFLDKAEECYRKALSLEPENPVRINNLAYFLIDRGRNTSEGLELADKALKISLVNFESLHCKGWGLYKQGKFQEAKDILQKSWDLRMKNAIYNYDAWLHLGEAKKAVEGMK